MLTSVSVNVTLVTLGCICIVIVSESVRLTMGKAKRLVMVTRERGPAAVKRRRQLTTYQGGASKTE